MVHLQVYKTLLLCSYLKGHSEFEEKEEVYSQLKSVQIHYSDIQNLVKFPNSIGIQRKCSLEAFALDNEFTDHCRGNKEVRQGIKG